MTKPKHLRPGDTIGILSPCLYYAPDQMDSAIAAIEGAGFHVKKSKNLYRNTDGYAASPEERAEDFHELIADPEVDMLLFSGGEVSNELLPLLNFDLIRANPKIICSYSDATSLLDSIWANTGLNTFYGFAPGAFKLENSYNTRQFESRLTDVNCRFFEKNSEWRFLCPGSAEGVLLGGYLVNFALLAGGAYLPVEPSEKILLFIEDNIKFNFPAAVSRYLSHISQSNLMSKVTGLLVGHYAAEPYPQIDEILTRFGNRHGIPVVRCEDFGHGENRGILPIGIHASLNEEGLTFLESPVL